MQRIELTEEQFHHAVELGEFGPEVIESNRTVIVVLTQDWCLQWVYMRTWLDEIARDDTVDIYELVYNRVPYFMEVLAYKEQEWGNFEIPYLRCYQNGRLIAVTNYIGKRRLKQLIREEGQR